MENSFNKSSGVSYAKRVKLAKKYVKVVEKNQSIVSLVWDTIQPKIGSVFVVSAILSALAGVTIVSIGLIL